MNLQLSNGAWLAMICLAGIVVASGLVLWSAWNKRGTKTSGEGKQSEGYTFTRAWQKEDEEAKKLSDAVRNLRGDKKDST